MSQPALTSSANRVKSRTRAWTAYRSPEEVSSTNSRLQATQKCWVIDFPLISRGRPSGGSHLCVNHGSIGPKICSRLAASDKVARKSFHARAARIRLLIQCQTYRSNRSTLAPYRTISRGQWAFEIAFASRGPPKSLPQALCAKAVAYNFGDSRLLQTVQSGLVLVLYAAAAKRYTFRFSISSHSASSQSSTSYPWTRPRAS